jgi:hypothetical protein
MIPLIEATWKEGLWVLGSFLFGYLVGRWGHRSVSWQPMPVAARAIMNDAEYEVAFAELERIMETNPALGSPEGERLDFLTSQIVAYERTRFPLPEPTPEEAAAFRAEQEKPKGRT